MHAPVLLAAAAALFLAGCSALDGTLAGGSTAEREVAWIERSSRWQVNLATTSARTDRLIRSYLAQGAEAGEVERSLAPLKRCSRSLAQEVGRAPSERLRPIHRLFADACRGLERAIRAQERLFRSNPGRALLEVETGFEGASYRLAEADLELQELIGDDRPLRRSSDPDQGSRIDPALGRVADAITRDRDRPTADGVEVRCWSEEDWPLVRDAMAALDPGNAEDYLGFVNLEHDRVNLNPGVCAGLAALRSGKHTSLAEQAEGALTLGHEVEHLVGPWTQAETECYGLQHVRAIARGLGASRRWADRLADYAWTEIYPEEDEEYVTPRCRNGGPLDLHPTAKRWP